MVFERFFFHEDDYGQIEILPLSDWGHCAEQLRVIGEHGETHRVPGGAGWSKIYLRPEAPRTLASHKIPMRDFSACIPPELKPCGRIYTGYSTYRERCRRTRGFLLGPHAALLVAWEPTLSTKIVSQCWLVPGRFAEGKRGFLVTALAQLGRLKDLLLVDWRGSLVDLKDPDSVGNYVEAL
jgi:hypothetical protein